MSYCLILNTSFHGLSVGIASLEGKQELLHQEHYLEARASSSVLGEIVEICLKISHLTQRHLSAVVVSVGPGSFTGIKIGLAFTYGFWRGSSGRVQLLGVSALQELARSQGGICVLPITKTHGFIVRSGEMQLFDLANAPGLPAHERYVLLKPWQEFSEKVAERHLSLECLELSQVSKQMIYGMWENAKQHWPEGFSQTLPQPLYLRKTTAEEKVSERRV